MATTIWDGMSGDEVLAALRAAPKVAGEWTDGNWYRSIVDRKPTAELRRCSVRSDLSYGFREDDVGECFAAIVEAKIVETSEEHVEGGDTVKTIRRTIVYMWQVDYGPKYGGHEGAEATFEEAKAAADAALLSMGYRFATEKVG